MILDSLARCALYQALYPGFQEAFSYLDACLAVPPKEGEYAIAPGVRASVQSYDTAPGHCLNWEAHRRYIDIQCILDGKEEIGWAPCGALLSPEPYCASSDSVLAARASAESRLPLEKGDFAVFFPQDAHKPHCQYGSCERVKKVVVKVAVRSGDTEGGASFIEPLTFI